MRRLTLLFFVLISCLVQTSEARKFALLIGVDEYINVPSLKCCVNDMKTLKEALTAVGFEEDDIQMLVTGGPYKDFPTKKNIERKLSQIILTAQPADMVFIAFSGHGAQDGSTVYFCPPDVEVGNLKGTCVSITKTMDLLAGRCKAQFKWMVVDACRNDPTEGTKGIGSKGLQVVPAPPAGIALFQSCAEGEESWEDRKSGNGYFTKNFAVALSGAADSDQDGQLTLFEVCKWTTAQTKKEVEKTQNKTQRPYFSGSVSDFTLIEDRNVPKARALVSEARAALKTENYELALKKIDEAVALCPKNSSLKREKDYVLRIINSKPKFNSMKISVPDDIPTIEEAYAKVQDGGVITIEPGEYELSKTIIVNRSVTFRGGGSRPEDVIINAPKFNGFELTDGSPVFQNLTVQSAKSVNLINIKITSGTPKLINCSIINFQGTGIHVEGEKANPYVESCFINQARRGIVVCKKGLGEFKSCEIFDSSPGITVETEGNPTFTECKIHKVSIYIQDEGKGSFNDCEIYETSGLGLIITTSANPTFTKCKIKDIRLLIDTKGQGMFYKCNISKGGNVVAIENSGNPTFTDCDIFDGLTGVRIYEKGLGEFRKCNIYKNREHGFYIEEFGNPKFIDCSIHDNKQYGVSISDAGMGMFKNNTLSKNKDTWGHKTDWNISSDAGKVTGSGNTPPIPEQD